MNVVKRALISNVRQPVKSGIFLLLIFLLSLLSSGAISVDHAITNTNLDLRRRMPAVATIDYHFNADYIEAVYAETGFVPVNETTFLTLEVLQKAGQLPQVKAFDYAIDMTWGLTAPNMVAWQDPFWYSPSPIGYDEDLGMGLNVVGVSTPDFLAIREDFMELVSGRSFSEVDLTHVKDVFPALITSTFAQVNELEVGSYFNAQIVIFDYIEDDEGSIKELRNRPLLVDENFSIEVIGIFNPTVHDFTESVVNPLAFEINVRQMIAAHRIYVPNWAAQRLFEARSLAPFSPDEVFFQNFFLLNDPLDFECFAEAVEALPGNWHAIDYSRGFEQISTAMQDLRLTADFLFFMTTGATFLIVSFLVFLFLHDRKHEIGIYLALGEKKKYVILQLFAELIPLALIGMTLALFASNLLARRLSEEMLRQNLAAQEQTEGAIHHTVHLLEELGYRFELAPEEMLASFEIRLDQSTIIFFYAFGLVTIVIAIVTPILYATNLSPKRLLM